MADRSRRILKVNAAFTGITGYDSTDVIGRELGATLADDLSVGLHDAIWGSVTADGRWQGEISGRRKDGSGYAALVAIDTVEGDAGQPLSYVASIFACAPIREALGRLHFLAHHDGLTGLANRLLFWARLEQSIERARRHRWMAAVLFIDLDRFKAINDRLGHGAGDQLLKCVATRLRGQVRGEDTVARLGGDEFGVIIEGFSSHADAWALARKLGAAISEPQHIDGVPIRAGASIGVGFCPDDGQTPEDLLKAADVAMYRAKRARRRQLGVSRRGRCPSSLGLRPRRVANRP